MQKPAPKTTGSVTLTRGFRISVAPQYKPEHSNPMEPRYIFSYRIRISNESEVTARLMRRAWLITDGHGSSERVEGEGVVGEQPELPPGGVFEYSSFCPLPTSWGTMEGAYSMVEIKPDGSTGESFDVKIGRFYLMLPDSLL